MNLSSRMRSSPKEAMASLLAEEMASCMIHFKLLVVLGEGGGWWGESAPQAEGEGRGKGPKIEGTGDLISRR